MFHHSTYVLFFLKFFFFCHFCPPVSKSAKFFFLFVQYSALLHLPPLRFHCVDGCWDRIIDDVCLIKKSFKTVLKRAFCIMQMVGTGGIHLIQIRIQHFRLNTDPGPGFWWTINGKNLQLEQNYIKNCNLPICNKTLDPWSCLL